MGSTGNRRLPETRSESEAYREAQEQLLSDPVRGPRIVLGSGNAERELPAWHSSRTDFPRNIREITPYLHNRYRFARALVINERGRLFDVCSIVSTYVVAYELQRPFFEVQPQRRRLAAALEALLEEHQGGIRHSETDSIRDIVDGVAQDAKWATSTTGWTPLVGGIGGPIRFGPESFRPHGGHGGRTTDVLFNRLVWDAGQLFHDRYRTEQGRVESRKEPKRTEGRSQWTDVLLFLVATRSAWHDPESQAGIGELYESALSTVGKSEGDWSRVKLGAKARSVLQARARRFQKSHRPAGFASPHIDGILRRTLTPER